jgi:small GTP-binding protein
MYNILIIGATGVGKSTLLNKIANKDIATVGYGVAPETKMLDKYVLNQRITLWDSPGLGEAIEKDKEYKKNLKKLLKSTTLIDLILIVIDLTDKRIETVSKLIKKIVKINPDLHDRFIFILNKVDEAKNHRYWNDEKNCPSKEQQQEITAKIKDYTKRIEEKTKVKIKLFLHCSAEYNYKVYTIGNSIYSYILNKHIKER